jgi:hypothetical protein
MSTPARGIRRLSAALLSLQLGAVGCGARATASGSDEPGDGPDGAGEGGRGPVSPAGSGGRRPSPDPPESVGPIDVGGTPLPACVPGFSPSRGGSRECTYMFSGQCYEQPLAACACACAGSASTHCIIVGFLNPDDPQTVSCIAR